MAAFMRRYEGETYAVYCFVFLYIAARGAGRWSVDGSRSHTGLDEVNRT